MNIPVDIKELWETPSLSSPDSAVSARAVALYSEWIDYAQDLGVHSVRCDPGRLNLNDLAPGERVLLRTVRDPAGALRASTIDIVGAPLQ